MSLYKLANAFDKVAKSTGRAAADHFLSLPKASHLPLMVGAGTLLAGAVTKSDSPLKDALLAGGVTYLANRYAMPWVRDAGTKPRKPAAKKKVVTPPVKPPPVKPPVKPPPVKPPVKPPPVKPPTKPPPKKPPVKGSRGKKP